MTPQIVTNVFILCVFDQSMVCSCYQHLISNECFQYRNGHQMLSALYSACITRCGDWCNLLFVKENNETSNKTCQSYKQNEPITATQHVIILPINVLVLRKWCSSGTHLVYTQSLCLLVQVMYSSNRLRKTIYFHIAEQTIKAMCISLWNIWRREMD